MPRVGPRARRLRCRKASKNRTASTQIGLWPGQPISTATKSTLSVSCSLNRNGRYGRIAACGVTGAWGMLQTSGASASSSASSTSFSNARPSPAGGTRFVLGAEPAFSMRGADARLTIIFLTWHMIDPLASGADIALYVAGARLRCRGRGGAQPHPRPF
jgi:hypothetical protein